MEDPAAPNQDFNLSTARNQRRCLELAEIVWAKMQGRDAPLRYVSDDPFEYDVQKRIPDVRKARDVLGFEATTSLDEKLNEVIPWIEQAIVEGRI